MKSLIFLANGFETCEALITVDMLRRAGITIDTVTLNADKRVTSSHQVEIFADYTLDQVDPSEYDLLILPGGKVGTKNLEEDERVIDAVKNHIKNNKLMAAICAAPSILGHLGKLREKKYTCYPTFDEASFGGEYMDILAIKDGKLITARGMGATIEFAREIIREVAGEEVLKQVENGMQYRR